MRVNRANAADPRTVMAVAAGVVILLAAIWAMAMGHLISLPLPLVWIIPLSCILIVAIAVLWAAGMFDRQE